MIRKGKDAIRHLLWRWSWGQKLVWGVVRLEYLLLALRYRLRPIPIQVMSIMDTIKMVRDGTMSMIRFGDGEVDLISGESLYFQKYDAALAGELTKLLTAGDEGLLICVSDIFRDMERYNLSDGKYFYEHLHLSKKTFQSKFDHDYVYGNTYVTRPYIVFKDKSPCARWFEELKTLWENADVVLIEGEFSRLGVGNDLFGGVRSLSRILCPPENAYDRYQEILAAALTVDRDKLILTSLGPTAKVLTYDLYRAGYRVLDIGHIDSEYEWFLRGATAKESIEGKHTADQRGELEAGLLGENADLTYQAQIIRTLCAEPQRVEGSD